MTQGAEPTVEASGSASVPSTQVDGTEDRPGFLQRPLVRFTTRRLLAGIVSVVLVSFVVFGATQALPGNAALAELSTTATPETLAALEEEMGINKPLVVQYGKWVSGLVDGSLGTSLATKGPVIDILGPRAVNTFLLVFVVAIVSTILAVIFGMIAALRRNGVFDVATSTGALIVSALPEFVVAIGVVMLLSTNATRIFPAVAETSAGKTVFGSPIDLVLPSITLLGSTTPYLFRMLRATLIETLQAEYTEMATLKGVRRARVLFVHALPNALPAVIQALASNVRFLVGGVVAVEAVFNFPGLGTGLLEAIHGRDIPTIQTTVVIMATCYVVLNLVADLVALLTSPRRRTALT